MEICINFVTSIFICQAIFSLFFHFHKHLRQLWFYVPACSTSNVRVSLSFGGCSRLASMTGEGKSASISADTSRSLSRSLIFHRAIYVFIKREVNLFLYSTIACMSTEDDYRRQLHAFISASYRELRPIGQLEFEYV